MDENHATGVPGRSVLLRRYMSALEQGDIDAATAIVHAAETDGVLERILLAANDVFLEQLDQSAPIASWDDAQPLRLVQTPSRRIQRDISRLQSRNAPRSGWIETAVITVMVAALVIGFIGGFFAFAPTHKRTSTPPSSTPVPTIIPTATSTHPMIIAGTQQGVITALDETNGSIVWRQSAPPIDSLVRSADIVYVATHPDKGGDLPAVDPGGTTRLIAYSAASGIQLWHVSEPQIAGYTYMYLDSGVLVVASGYGDGSVYGMDAHTGKTLWRSPGVGGLTQRLMGATGGIAYLANQETDINAYNIHTGKFLWTYASHQEVSVAGGQNRLVYFSGGPIDQYSVLAVDSATGSLQSSLDFAHVGYPQFITTDGTAYTAKNGDLCSFRVADRTQLWCVATNESEFQALDAQFVSSPTELLYSKIANGGSSQDDPAVVIALNRSTGKQLWNWQGPSSLYSAENSMSFVHDGDTVFLTTNQGMYAFRMSDGKILWHALEATNLSFVRPAVVSQDG